jgi:hypothetical protein
MRDMFEFSASFPRTHAFKSTWDTYVERTIGWCDRLMADTSLIQSSPALRHRTISQQEVWF